jgi:hypothetical protein
VFDQVFVANNPAAMLANHVGALGGLHTAAAQQDNWYRGTRVGLGLVSAVLGMRGAGVQTAAAEVAESVAAEGALAEGAAGSGLASDAFVVRGGVATPEQIARGIGPHRDVGGLTGFSAQSRGGASIEELASTGGVGGGPFPHGKISVTTVGDLRCIRCDVVPSPGGGTNHVAHLLQRL